MPESASGDRRRAQVISTLRLVARMADYCAGQVTDGLSPEEARLAVWQVSGDLAELATTLRTLARPEESQQAAVARLSAAGVPERDIAVRLGMTGWRVRACLRSVDAGQRPV